MEQKSFVGLIGLGVMGQNLALNIGRKGYSVTVYNRTQAKADEFIRHGVKDEPIIAKCDLESFMASLERPRKVILMVQAGKAVDAVIESLLPYTEPGDLIIDAGNSHYPDTERRMAELDAKEILFLGMGVSGGEYGALHGPSIMPGGPREAYDLVAEMLSKIAAQTEDGPCCTYLGEGSAGHFVKMIHNGIEYAIMQNTSEAYDVMRDMLGMSAPEISTVFEKWNAADLNSYLYEISYKVLQKTDEDTGRPLVDMILDKAEQKGTGKWTSQAALDLGVPAPSLGTAVASRTISHFKDYRVRISGLSAEAGRAYPYTKPDKECAINDLMDACLFAMFISFSQGTWLMSAASEAFGYALDLSEVMRIWKGGCIIRAKMLNFIREVVQDDPSNSNLLMDEKSVSFLETKLGSVNRILALAREWGIPMPVLSSAADYYLSMSKASLPANFIQAQRDFFGAHTYERTDKPGYFHTEWE
ncbi:MAG: NADP-dependent phosphogluconate dehydrogenase [Armatimonadota bacterium]